MKTCELLTYDACVSLVSYGTEMLELSSKFLRSVCCEEVVTLEGRETAIACALSVVNVLLASWEDSTKHLQEGEIVCKNDVLFFLWIY